MEKEDDYSQRINIRKRILKNEKKLVRKRKSKSGGRKRKKSKEQRDGNRKIG